MTARLLRSSPASRRRRTSARSCSNGSRIRSCQKSATKTGRRCGPSTSTSWPRAFVSCSTEQKERHDGGNRWIGTGGTSPFGHGGEHPTGVRVGGEGGGRSAVQVAGSRRFRNLRSDRILDTRQIGIALRRLKRLDQRRRPRGTANWTTRSTTAPATAERSSLCSGRRGETASSCCC